MNCENPGFQSISGFLKYDETGEYMYESRNDGYNRRPDYSKAVNIPLELYESMKGEYFMGYADNLTFGKGKSAWARLYNPRNSGRIVFQTGRGA
jgi:hypothetical protein